jgi:YVTN family beta-propeller protein
MRWTSRGFITSGQTDSVVAFDTGTLARTAEIKVGRKPDAIVYDPSTKQVFAMNGDGASSTVIRAADNQAVGTVALGGGPESPWRTAGEACSSTWRTRANCCASTRGVWK